MSSSLAGPDRDVKLYLLLVNDEEHFFYSSESEADDSREEMPARSGLAGWLEARWRQSRTAFHEADAGVARWLRRAWDRLHSLAKPDESMLVRLRSARRIELHHPASRTAECVRTIWHGYLGHRRVRHGVYLCLDASIAPLALVLLWPLPGPNLIGYWFAYRAIHHWLILKGVRAVLRGKIVTEYHAEKVLDLPVESDRSGQMIRAPLGGRDESQEDHQGKSQPAVGAKERGTG